MSRAMGGEPDLLSPRAIPWRRVLRTVGWVGWSLTLGVMIVALVAWPIDNGARQAWQIGQAAPQTIFAPYELRYPSAVLTEQAREAAAAQVAPIYTSPDPRIARQQVEKLRQTVEAIAQLRAETLPLEEKARRLEQMSRDYDLSPEQRLRLLTADSSRWELITGEAIRLLDQIMREPIREDEVPAVLRELPRQVTARLTEEEASLVVRLVTPLIIPNSILDTEATEAARRRAREAVPPQIRQIRAGEAIIRQGDILDALALEALQQYGLISPALPAHLPIARGAIAGLGVIGLLLLLQRLTPEVAERPRRPMALLGLFLLFTLSARLVTVFAPEWIWAFPAAALGMLIATGLGTVPGLLLSAIWSLWFGLIADRTPAFLAASLLANWVTILMLHRLERFQTLLMAGLSAGAITGLIGIAATVEAGSFSPLGALITGGMGLLAGALSITITLIGFIVLGTLFDVTTPLHLLELARPTHPLLQQLMVRAPGTYHHTLMVANLAEQAALRIGADPLLARVGALYHDIGKMIRPYLFVENQVNGDNPHEQMDPYASAQAILRHVEDGLALARRYHLPRRVRAFIQEHHGTLCVTIPYHRAVQEAGNPEKVDRAAFCYRGPRPRSKETAIVMLADGCEAAVRAARPKDPQELAQILERVFQERIQAGQLDEAPLTMQDLQGIREAFLQVFQGMFHPRLIYPDTSPR
ncbi:Cyclic-di-AMP phosphodiesterase PgpH [Candidatus Thermoflexus japonica]|uniref:Cyclic-di-AMP phosphodiesterase PgpH n=1 Tax=Candidatus Thermoflexus japonica TaxID=2035417 RepID=A0A2H5Y8R6_9CHLR|nr:Cyclic-di-AMP phosphodiesterase PgpH [Candidatus Thermoflexus japonica]